MPAALNVIEVPPFEVADPSQHPSAETAEISRVQAIVVSNSEWRCSF